MSNYTYPPEEDNGGGGAPLDAEYLLLNSNPDLSSAKVFIDGVNSTLETSGANVSINACAGSVVVSDETVIVDDTYPDLIFVDTQLNNVSIFLNTETLGRQFTFQLYVSGTGNTATIFDIGGDTLDGQTSLNLLDTNTDTTARGVTVQRGTNVWSIKKDYYHQVTGMLTIGDNYAFAPSSRSLTLVDTQLAGVDNLAAHIYTLGLAENSRIFPIDAGFDNGISVLTASSQTYVQVHFNCEIDSVTLLSLNTGSIEIDIYKTDYDGFPGTVANSITGSSPPTITNDNKYTDSTLAGWTTTITAGDVLIFNINSVVDLTNCKINLKVIRT